MDEDDTALSFQEWNESGYYIKKGSKSPFRDIHGVPQFTKSQVEKKKVPIQRVFARYQSRSHPVMDKADMIRTCSDAAFRKGTPWGVVEDFDSFVRQASLLPTMERTVFAVNDPLERHFMSVADKHGVLDAILDGEWEY